MTPAPDPVSLPSADDAALLFDRRAFPHHAMRVWCWLIAAGTCAGTTFLLPLLIPADHLSAWGILGLLLGLGFGAMIIASVGTGTRITVDHQGMLNYSLGSRANLRIDIRTISKWGAVSTGMLKGIGADCPIPKIEILHRKGVRIPQMQEQQKHLGFALVFEFHDPTDIPALESLAAGFGSEDRPDPASP